MRNNMAATHTTCTVLPFMSIVLLLTERVKNPFQHHPTLCFSSFTGTVCFMQLHIFICLVYSACVLLVSVTVKSLFAQLDSSLPQFILYLICCAVALFWTAGGSFVYAVTALLLDGCFGKFFGTEWCIIAASTELCVGSLGSVCRGHVGWEFRWERSLMSYIEKESKAMRGRMM